MSVYTEEYLKNKLIEKLAAVHVVSEIGAWTVDVYKRRDKINFFMKNSTKFVVCRLRHCFLFAALNVTINWEENNAEKFWKTS